MSWLGDAWVDDTYTRVTQWCPLCNPDATNLTDPWEMVYCEAHLPDRSGDMDKIVEPSSYIAAGEAGGVDNIRFGDLIHRGPKETS